jgi:hypothetical protein
MEIQGLRLVKLINIKGTKESFQKASHYYKVPLEKETAEATVYMGWKI